MNPQQLHRAGHMLQWRDKPSDSCYLTLIRSDSTLVRRHRPSPVAPSSLSHLAAQRNWSCTNSGAWSDSSLLSNRSPLKTGVHVSRPPPSSQLWAHCVQTVVLKSKGSLQSVAAASPGMVVVVTRQRNLSSTVAIGEKNAIYNILSCTALLKTKQRKQRIKAASIIDQKSHS